jgi:hypothetical protein
MIFSQRSFAAGEISPSLYARVDFQKYGSALRTLHNMYVMRHGGATNRAGTEFIAEVKDSSKNTRLVSCIGQDDNIYVCEFGDEYVRLIGSSGRILRTAQNISGITNANPAVVTYSGDDNYVAGDHVEISGVAGALGNYLNGRTFKVGTVSTAGAGGTFQLLYLDGTNVNSTSWGAYTSGGTVEEVYEITSPYDHTDVFEIRYDQKDNILTTVHPDYQPRSLSILDDGGAFSLFTTTPGSTVGTAYANYVNYSGISFAGSTYHYRYHVTGIDASGVESLPLYESFTRGITAATKASPCVLTFASAVPNAWEEYVTGDQVYISGVGGMTELNGNTYTITWISTTSVSLNVDSTGFGTYTSGGGATRPYAGFLTGADRRSQFNAGTGVLLQLGSLTTTRFNVYITYFGVKALIGGGTVNGTGSDEWLDTGTDPDITSNPPEPNEKFDAVGEYPSTVAWVQQRHTFAGSDLAPATIDASKVGDYDNFSVKYPITDDDPFSLTISGARRAQRVQHLLDVGGKFVALTTEGVWFIPGNTDGVLTPGSAFPKLQSSYGANDLSPLIVGETALYVQSRGSGVRDLAFDYQVDGYRGNELTLLSSHIIEGKEIVSWAYQQVPHSVVWCVLDDGTVASLTYVKEQQVYAWATHDFGGLAKSVCSVPGTNEDNIYFVIERTIGGATKKYIEKLTSRYFADIEDAAFMDSWVEYDGTHTGVVTMTLSGGTDWTYDEELTLTASGSTFTSAYVGNQIHLTGTDGTEIRFSITGYTSATVVTGTAHMTVPAAMRSTAISDWAYAVDEFSGIWHLEGEDVVVFADGNVLASPNNDGYTVYTVTNGAITLDRCYAKVKVGLPYISDIETLDVDTANGEPLMDKNKLVTALNLHMESTRGGFVGPKPPSDDTTDPLEGLTEIKYRDAEGVGETTDLFTGVKEINIEPEWNSNGRAFVRQVDPLPMTVLAISPAGMFPVRGG